MKKETFNLNIIISLIIFAIISILTIYTTIPFLKQNLHNLYLKQIFFYLLGFIITIFITFKGFDLLKKYHFLVYIGINVLLLSLIFFGYPINGSKCWIIIGPLTFQPSELMKISLIITLSMIITKFLQKDKKSMKDEFILLLKLFIITLIPSILTFLEPDTGVVIIYFLIFLTSLFFIKLNKKWYLIFSLCLVFLIVTVLLLYVFSNDLFMNILSNNFYRLDRILNWKNASGYQLENSLITISNSGLTGFGFNKNIIYFPEPQTDFIFSIITEEFGFIGALTIIILFIILFYNIIKKAIDCNDLYGKYLIFGLSFLLMFQTLLNLSVVVGLVPITGVTLPFISYGGSSLVVSMISIEIILNVECK